MFGPSYLSPRLALLATVSMLLSACAAGPDSPVARAAPPEGETLAGRILDVRANRFISRDELVKLAVASRLVILGEVHDNAVHHRLQTEVFQALVGAGRSPALAMEQFDREHQPSMDAARGRGERDAERIADAGRFDRKGWRWPDYKPLVEIAAANGLPILAANFSRVEARALMKLGRPAEGLEPAPPAIRAALERDLVGGHCGIRPSEPMLSGMIEAQRARDALMAQTLANAGPGGALLIAGSGHARRDRGAPSYLTRQLAGHVLSIAFVEVDPANEASAGRFGGIFDVVWFTQRAEREDPCKNLRLR